MLHECTNDGDKAACHAAWVWEVHQLECVTAGCPSLADAG